MFHSFLVGQEKGGGENRVNLPARGNLEVEGCVRDDFFYFKRTSSFLLELFGSVHVEVSHFEPDLGSYFPGKEFSGYSFLHLLLSHFVGGLGIISGSR